MVRMRTVRWSLCCIAAATAPLGAMTTIVADVPGTGVNGGTNSNIPNTFGDNVSATAAGIFTAAAGQDGTVGTPQVDLGWSRSGTTAGSSAWQFHSATAATPAVGGGALQMDGSTEGSTYSITFTPAAGTSAILNSFNFANDSGSAGAPANVDYNYTVNVVDVTSGNVLYTTNVAFNPSIQNTTALSKVSLGGTIGGAGKTLRVDFVRTATVGTAGSSIDIYIDNLSFDQMVITTPPATLTKTYTHSGGSITVNYALHNVRGPNFGVYNQNPGGGYTAFTTPRPNRTYLGTVTGYPGAIAAAQLLDDGNIRSTIIFEDGTEWRGTGLAMTLPAPASWTPQYPPAVVPAGGAGSTVHAADIALDFPTNYYKIMGSNAAKVVEMAEYTFMQADAIYLRDAAIKMEVARVIVRTSPADDPYPAGGSLGVAREQWNNVLPGVLPATSYDAMHVVPGGNIGGVSYLGSITNNYGVGLNGSDGEGSFYRIWRHEVAHSWGANDLEGGTSEGPTVVSGNALSRFSGPELAKIVAKRVDKVSFFPSLGSYTYPLPPRANADRGIVDVSRTPITLDVMANDSDSNGQSITLPSFQATSDQGGTITRSVGTGAGGKDRLIYTPSSSFTSGVDRFNYRIKDSSNLESVGWVLISSAPQPAAPWASADVGTVGTVGGTSFDGTSYSLMGSGADIWGTADGFRYVYQPLTGDGEIVARVASTSSATSSGRSGVMIRESLTAGSKHVSTMLHLGHGRNVTTRRITTGGSSTEVSGPTAAAPTWVKLTRTGDDFVSATSTDGTTWTTLSTTNVSMAGTIYIGLAVSSLNNSSTRVAAFDSVTVTP